MKTRELIARGAWYWSNQGPATVDHRFAGCMNLATDGNSGIALSTVLGPSDWEIIFSDTDAEHLQVLQNAQDELCRAGVPASGNDPFGFYSLPD